MCLDYYVNLNKIMNRCVWFFRENYWWLNIAYQVTSETFQKRQLFAQCSWKTILTILSLKILWKIDRDCTTFLPKRYFSLWHFSLRLFSLQHFSLSNISPFATFLPYDISPCNISPYFSKSQFIIPNQNLKLMTS